jgi:hypothetical protein
MMEALIPCCFETWMPADQTCMIWHRTSADGRAFVTRPAFMLACDAEIAANAPFAYSADPERFAPWPSKDYTNVNV